MDNLLLAVDAGGTFAKAALMDAMGAALPGTERQFPVEEAGSAEAIEDSYRAIARYARVEAAQKGGRVAQACVSTPGPFRFADGVSLMRHKFAAIYGQSLAPFFRTELPDARIDFLHDSTAFLLGEALPDEKDLAGVMLGTGFGFTWQRKGKVCVDANGTPAAVLWNRTFREGTVEDYVSRRAIRARYAAMWGGPEMPDVKEIAERALAGERMALTTFQETGELLGEILAPVLDALGVDHLVVGGQIARSAALFLPAAEAALTGLGTPCAVRVAAHPADAALRGAARYACEGRGHTTETLQPEEISALLGR